MSREPFLCAADIWLTAPPVPLRCRCVYAGPVLAVRPCRSSAAPTAPESHYGAGLALASASSSEAGGPTGLPVGYPASTGSSCDSASLGKRAGPPSALNPLRSFSVPAPPPPLTVSRPLGSPLKKPAFSCMPRAPEIGSTREELTPLRVSLATGAGPHTVTSASICHALVGSGGF